MGLSWALTEHARLHEGRVVDDDLDRYRLLRAARAPEVRTVLLGAEHRVGGTDEAAAAPVAVALADAVHALTGQRLRESPLRQPSAG